MTVITATYRIVTPMFLGGADQKATSLRPPSVKGALRFWWRALNWGRCLCDARGQETEAIRRLHQQEAGLFGSAADEGGSGQGRFLLRVNRQPTLAPLETDWPQNNTGSGYLGYGLMATTDKPHREGLREGAEFGLELRFKPGTPDIEVDAIIQTLRVWSLFGGLGSRPRRGFGSVTLLELNGEDMKLDREGYVKAARAVLDAGSQVDQFPPYTAFSHHASFGTLVPGHDARQVHNQAGLLYKNHRGQPSQLRGQIKIPFGLPLQGVDQDSRRASPLFFHIHALRNNSFVAVALYLPAQFHYEARYQPTDLARFYQPVFAFVPAAVGP